MTKPSALVMVGDYHTGSKVSLCPPDGVELDDGDFYSPNLVQKELAKFYYLDFIPWVKQRTKNYRVILEDGGDSIDGAGHHNSLQTYGTNDDAEQIHLDLIGPLTDIADEIIVIRGTRAHVGMSSESDQRIARKLGVKAQWRYHKTIDGQLVDIRHHASAGRRAWTRGNSLYALMKDERFNALEAGEQPPALIVRHHVHIFDAITDWRLGMSAVACPAWKLSDEYGMSLPVDLYDCGGAIYFFDTRQIESRLYRPR